MSETLELAVWMRSSLPKEWLNDSHASLPKSRIKISKTDTPQSELLSKINIPDIPVKALVHSLFNQFVKSREKSQTELPRTRTPIETGSRAACENKSQELLHNTKTLIAQTTRYLVEASKKGQLPRQISTEEFNATATEIVQFLEQLAEQVNRRVKKASTEILAFSQQAQANTGNILPPNIEGTSLNIFQLTQGALRFLDPRSFLNFKDEQQYNQCIAKLTEMVANGVASETSKVGARKKV